MPTNVSPEYVYSDFMTPVLHVRVKEIVLPGCTLTV
jgi:hypothetical protein